MSVIIAVKGEDGIYFGFDTGSLVNSSLEENLRPNNAPVFPLNCFPHALLGIPGANPASNIFKTTIPLVGELELIHKEVDFNFVVRKLVPRMKECLNYFEALYKDGVGHGYIPPCVFAFENDLYEINSNGFVIQIDDFYVISNDASAEQIAIASLTLSKDIKNPYERIVNAIRAASEMSFMSAEHCVVINTNEMEYHLVDLYKTEEKKSEKKEKK